MGGLIGFVVGFIVGCIVTRGCQEHRYRQEYIRRYGETPYESIEDEFR